MNKIARWVRDNALIAIAMTLTGGGVAGVYQAQEVTGTQYRVLAETWPQLKPETRQAVRAAMEGGRISRWTYSTLFREVMADAQVIAFTPGLQADPEREALQKILLQQP